MFSEVLAFKRLKRAEATPNDDIAIHRPTSGRERKLDGVEVRRVCRKVEKTGTRFLNQFPNARNLVNRRVVDNKNRIWKRPCVHAGQ